MKSIHKEIKQLIEAAIQEDVDRGDITSEACISKEATLSGKLLLKEGGRVAGLPFLEAVFQRVDPRIQVFLDVEEGSDQTAGTILGTILGPARGILTAEFTALMIIQHASGIATATQAFVEEVEGYPCEILDTRKTLPGMRALQKYAIKVGGGVNHRFSLSDRFVIKRKHLAFVANESPTPILTAVERARQSHPEIRIEVEVENLKMVEEALKAEVDVIFLQRMTIPMVAKAVRLIDGRAYVEAGGSVTIDTVRSYAACGLNGVAIGSLTHSVDNLDISLRF